MADKSTKNKNAIDSMIILPTTVMAGPIGNVKMNKSTTIKQSYKVLGLESPIEFAKQSLEKLAEKNKNFPGDYNENSLEFIGRQCGKTTLSIITALTYAMNGLKVGFVTKNMSSKNYTILTAGNFAIKLNCVNSFKKIKFITEHSKDEIRGMNFDAVIFDF